MAYASTEGGYGASASVFHLDASHPDHLLIPDAELLFTGDFKRHGPDLVLTGHDGDRHIIPGYFSSEQHPALIAPNGAGLSGALIDLLAGSQAPGQYAQAQPTASADPIGKVEKIVGHVVVVRNGVAVALNVGDAVYKSDVIQTGTNSACGVSFPDGTALNLVANTRMALNDYSYDPNSNANDAVFSLVQGTFAFVAGKVAHSGDMKIETPVATMGIRGTTGFVQEQVGTITANVGNVTYSFAVTEDQGTGRVGQYELIDGNGNVIATVSQDGFVTYVTPQGPNQPPLVSTQPMTASQLGFEQQIIQQVFQVLNQSTNNNPTPQPNPSNPGSSTPPEQLHENLPQLLQNNNDQPFTVTVGNGPGGQSTTVTIQTSGTSNIPQNNSGSGNTSTPTTTTYVWDGSNNPWDTAPSWNPGSVPNGPNNNVAINSGTPQYDDNSTIGSLFIAPGAELDVIGGSLIVNGLTNGGTVDVGGDPPLMQVSGGVVLAGTTEATSAGAEILFTAAVIDSLQYNLIVATHGGEVVFDNSDLQNESHAQLIAAYGGTISFEQSTFTNAIDAALKAEHGGAITIDQTDVGNGGGKIIADGNGSHIDFSQATLTNTGADDNAGLVLAGHGGRISFDESEIDNGAGGAVLATDGGSIRIDAGDVDNGAQAVMEAIGRHSVINIDGGTFNNYGTTEAKDFGTISFGDLPDNPLPVTNEDGGKIEAKNHGTVKFFDVNVTNDSGGVIEANDGLIEFKERPDGAPGGIINDGTILAKDRGAVVFSGVGAGSTGGLFNEGTVAAVGHGATVDFYNSALNSGIWDSQTSSWTGGGTLAAVGGTIFVSSDSTVNGNVAVNISDGGLADFADVINENASVTVTFCGGGTLQLDQAPNTGESATPVAISNFGCGDIIDLTNLAFAASGATLSYDCSDGQLTVSDGCSSETFTLQDGTYSQADFTLLRDPQGGTEIVYGTRDFWSSYSSGDWANCFDWCGGTPGTSDTAEIVTSGSYVTIDDEETVGNLVIGASYEGGQLDIDNGGLQVLGAVDVVNGAIAVDGADCDPYLRVNGLATVEGSGAITATGAQAVVEFRSGTGNFGEIAAEQRGWVRFDDAPVWNEGGTIKASSGGKVKFDASTVDNESDGTIEAKYGGAISFKQGSVDNQSGGIIKAEYFGTISMDDATVDNESCATITAEGCGSKVRLFDDVVENCGVIAAVWGGALLFADTTVDNARGATLSSEGRGSNAQLYGNNFDNWGRVDAGHHGELVFSESQVNNERHGAIDADGYGSVIKFDGDHLDSSGRMAAEYHARINFYESQVDNERHGTIEANGWGSEVAFARDRIDNSGRIEAERHGRISFYESQVDNERHDTIEANGCGSEVRFDRSHVDNSGWIKAEYHGTIEIDQTTVDNCGMIAAYGIGSAVQLSDATIIGGRLETGHCGIIETLNGATFVGVTLAGGDFETNNCTSLNLQGPTTIEGTVTFEGNGTFALDDASSAIAGGSCGATLDNDATISGYGTIGNDNLVLHNEAGCGPSGAGTINANVSGETLTLDTGHTINNGGTLEASNGGTLHVDDPVSGCGNVLVEGGTVNFAQSANVTTITFDNGACHTDYGEVVFQNPTGHIDATVDGFAGVQADNPSVANSDVIELTGAFTVESENLTNSGTIVTLDLKDESSDAEHGAEVTLTFDNPSGTVNVNTVNGNTLITDPPAQVAGPSVTVGNDHFVFAPNLGTGGDSSGAPEDTHTPLDHAGWAHSEEWSALVADAQDAAVEGTHHTDASAHWHAAVQHAFHLH